MITIGYSTRFPNDNYKKYIQKTCMYKNVEVIEKVNNGEKSLSQVYNEIIDESNNDIVVLIHDDLEFDTKNWGEKIIDHFKKNSEYGILGLAGSKFLHENAQWWVIPQTMYGIVNHKDGGKKWTSTYSKDLGVGVEDVVLIDGLFMAFNKNKIKHKFDETIEGFHFYDLGFCVPNFLDDVNIGVIFNVRVTHLSVGKTNDSWERNRLYFSEKYKSDLPIEIYEENVSETFIFVHNQDYILDFEKNNKFQLLNKYTYVFLGNGNIDKLSEVRNLIVARNLKHNIEQYPKLTSFTGWYCLWKNNLISTNYVNLFEYDILINPNIEQYLNRFYYENMEIVGFVPLQMSNFHFIENKRWNEHILPSIKKHYKVDLKEVYSKQIMSNPNTVWSTTSNVTMRFDIFNSYMNWFQPILNDIIETETSGHAFERSITYFSTIKNKKFLITNGLIKHLQLDTHKTQGHEVNMDQQYVKLVTNTFA
jgi:hypothetical protein